MTKEELQNLEKIAYGDGFKCRSLLRDFLKGVSVEEAPKGATTGQNTRSSAQHRALFAWYGQIEKLAQNEGVTWDRLIKHTHQLKVTKDNLHEAGKQLQKALFGKYSTKDLEKQQIDTLIDHFVDWFAKEGLELPPFPTNQQPEYPRDYQEPTI